MTQPVQHSEQNSAKSPLFYGSLVLLQCLLWGVGNPIMKIGLETVPPFLCLAIRYALAFFLFMLFMGRRILPYFKKENFKGCLIISLFTAASFICSTLALLYTESTIVGFLMSLAVVFTPILSFFVLKQKTSRVLLFIIAVVVLGMYFLCGNIGSFSFGKGELLAVLSAVCGAAMLTYSSRHVSAVGPFALSAAQSAITSVLCFMVALFFEDSSALKYVSAECWFSVVYLAVACTCIAYSLQNIALDKVSATFVSLAFCTEPIFTAIASFFLLKEKLSLFGWIGSALILTGIVLASIFVSREDNNSQSLS